MTPAQKEENGSERHLFRLLQAEYRSDHYVLLKQVKSAVSGNFRTADAVAVGVWKSRDSYIHGFEMKSSRASWLQELNNPAKAEEIGRYCHYWWIVASNARVVNPEELPESWGLYVLAEGKLKSIVPAKKIDPRPLDSTFVASLLRSAGEQGVLGETGATKDNAYDEGHAAGFKNGQEHARKSTNDVIDNLTKRLHEKTKLMEEFEGMLGLSLRDLDFEAVKALRVIFDLHRMTGKYKGVSPERIKELLEAYKFIANGPIEHVTEQLARVSYAVKDISRLLDEKLEQLPKIERDYHELYALREDAKKILSDPLPQKPPLAESSGA